MQPPQQETLSDAASSTGDTLECSLLNRRHSRKQPPPQETLSDAASSTGGTLECSLLNRATLGCSLLSRRHSRMSPPQQETLSDAASSTGDTLHALSLSPSLTCNVYDLLCHLPSAHFCPPLPPRQEVNICPTQLELAPTITSMKFSLPVIPLNLTVPHSSPFISQSQCPGCPEPPPQETVSNAASSTGDTLGCSLLNRRHSRMQPPQQETLSDAAASTGDILESRLQPPQQDTLSNCSLLNRRHSRMQPPQQETLSNAASWIGNVQKHDEHHSAIGFDLVHECKNRNGQIMRGSSGLA